MPGLQILQPLFDFFVADLDIEPAIGNIEVNNVAFPHSRNRSADKSFRSNVAGGEAARRTGEAAIGK